MVIGWRKEEHDAIELRRRDHACTAVEAGIYCVAESPAGYSTSSKLKRVDAACMLTGLGLKDVMIQLVVSSSIS